MAVEQPIPGGAMQMPFGAHTTEVTLSPQSLCHYITDEELERLGDMRKEPVMEIFLCSVGAFAGAVLPALQVVRQFNTDATKVGLLDMVTLMMAVATLAVAILSGILWRQRLGTHKSMVTIIRERPRAPVRLAYDNVA